MAGARRLPLAERARAVRGGTAFKAGAKVREYRLDNGLQLLLAERRNDPVVSVMTWYKVGVRNEAEREAGFSHFLEHMMFKGSRRFGRGAVDRVTAELGGSNNAFTSYDHTAYWFELASDRWERALEMEADRMRHLTLDEGEFKSEREVVLEELAMGHDDPWRMLAERVQTALFARHPYRRPVVGYADSLRAACADDLRSYYDRFYHPSNAILVLCGDFRTRAAIDAVERTFGRLPSGAEASLGESFRSEPDVPAGEIRLAMDWDDAARRLCVVWPTAPVASDDDFALDVISALLTGGRLSRLHRRLVLDDGLATTVSFSNDTRIDTGVMWCMAECSQGVELEQLEAALDEELERLASERVPARELRRVKSMLAASEAYDVETASDLAESLGEYAVDCDWRVAVEATERMLAITSSQLRDCAARLLQARRRVVGWCLPAASGSAVRPLALRQAETGERRKVRRGGSRPRTRTRASTRGKAARGGGAGRGRS